MTITISVQHITGAEASEFEARHHIAAFDIVQITTSQGGHVSLFLPYATGASVAHAINSALGGNACQSIPVTTGILPTTEASHA